MASSADGPGAEPSTRPVPHGSPPPPGAYPRRSAGSFGPPPGPAVDAPAGQHSSGPPAPGPPAPWQAQDEQPPEPGAGPGPASPPARPSLASSPRFWLTMVAAVLGLAGLAASAAGLAAQVLPRKFSATQQRQIMSWQTASRWRDWPAGKIFPATVRYQLSGTDFDATSGLTLQAHRVGIARQSSCAGATDKPLARVLAADGCQGVLRATYTDATDSFAVTVGIAVMRRTAPALSSLPQAKGLRPGVNAVPFSHSLAAGFSNRDRQLSGAYRRGPYLVLYTVGYTDSRHFDHVARDSYAASEMTGVGAGLAGRIGSALGAAPPAPKCPGAPGC